MPKADDTPPKDSRLNIRMNTKLKRWFKRYAASRGGMSKIVESHVTELKEGKNGREPDERAGD